jgi:hypothetical protein
MPVREVREAPGEVFVDRDSQDHVVSSSAAATAQDGLSTYGPNVRLRGSDGRVGGPILK